MHTLPDQNGKPHEAFRCCASSWKDRWTFQQHNMWPTKEFQDDTRPVTLILGEEKTKIEGLETSFLATVSPVFRAMFYDGYAEAQKDTIEFPECDAEAVEKILSAMKDAMNDNMSVEEKIAEIISPELYPTLLYFQIGSNLEGCLLSRMRFDQMEEYKTLAQQTDGNKLLLKAIEWKSLTFFLKYRRTKAFKKKSIEELVAYLSHPYLEYRVEKEVLEAALFWLNYDFEQRKVHMKEVLSCVNWNRITKSQSQAACFLKILCKSTTLRDFFDGIYEKKSRKLKRGEATRAFFKGYKLAAILLKGKMRKKRKYLLSVPFAFKESPQGNFTYGICIYNSKTEKFKEHVFLLPGNKDTDLLGFVDVKFFDFHIYSFMQANISDTDPLCADFGFNIEKHSTLAEGLQRWMYLGKYGKYGKRAIEEVMCKQCLFEALTISDKDPIPQPPFENRHASVVSRGTKMFLTLNETDTFDTYQETVAPNYVFDAGNHGHTQESVAKEHEKQISRGAPASEPNQEDEGPSHDYFGYPIRRGPVCAAFAKTIETPQSLQIFKDKLKTHVDSKINKNAAIFEIAEKLVQRVNPLWFKKFP